MKGVEMETKAIGCFVMLFVLSSVVFAANPPAETDPNQFDTLVQVIEKGNTYQRAEAIPSLARLDDIRVVPILMGLLADPNERVRIYAAQQLSSLGDERATDALAEALSDPSKNVRRYGGEALVKIGSKRHVPALVASVVNYLPDPSTSGYESNYSAPALEAIGKWATAAPPEIVTLLDRVSDETIAENQDWWLLLTNVANCLGQIGDKAALEGLKRAVESLERHYQDYNTWYAVRKAMTAIDPTGEPFNRPAADILVTVRMGKITNEWIKRQWVLPLAELGPDAVGDLEWVLRFSDQARKRVALDALGEMGGTEAAKVLRQYIQRLSGLPENEKRFEWFLVRQALLSLLKANTCVETAEEVARQTGTLGDFEQEWLVANVEQEPAEKLSTEVRIAFFKSILSGGSRYAGPRAAQALGRIGGPEAGNVLRRTLLTPSVSYREAAARALGVITDYDALTVLLEVSKPLDAPAGAIAWALGNIGDKRAISVLVRMIDEAPKVSGPGVPPRANAAGSYRRLSETDRLWIAAALARLGHDYEANAALIRAKLPQTIEHAAWLNDSETVEALAKLIPSRERGDTRVIDTLVTIGTPEALDALMSLADAEKDPLRIENLCTAAANLGEKLGHPKTEQYRIQATVTNGVRHWFIVSQRALPSPEERENYALTREHPDFARRIWILEATQRLDLALRAKHDSGQYFIPPWALQFAQEAFTSEMVPVLERIIAESTQTVSFHGKDGMIEYYQLRSRAAAILTAKTEREYTFVDIDGRTHPGGWRPLMEP